MIIDMLTLKIISICIILIELLLKRWLHAFFNKQRLKFEFDVGVFTSSFVLVHKSIKIYSFQAAGKNEIKAKNVLFPDIYILLKSSTSDGTQFFA